LQHPLSHHGQAIRQQRVSKGICNKNTRGNALNALSLRLAVVNKHMYFKLTPVQQLTPQTGQFSQRGFGMNPPAATQDDVIYARQLGWPGEPNVQGHGFEIMWQT
jgi:hypothetical protein